MKVRSINQLKYVRKLFLRMKHAYLVKFWKMNIHPSCSFSLSARFDTVHPKGIHIGAQTYIAFDAAILTHDRARGIYTDTFIGKNCFIGARSLILPGVRIGDDCIIGAGSIVIRNVPDRTMVAGNPARILRGNLEVGPYGRLKNADENEHAAKKLMYANAKL